MDATRHSLNGKDLPAPRVPLTINKILKNFRERFHRLEAT